MIDIIVPTYNRYNDLKKFISEIKKQTFKEFNVIIIDDYGEDKIVDLIPDNDIRFKYYRLEKNYGQAYARNYGVDKSLSKYLIFLDDDAWFINETALEDFVRFVENSTDDAWMFDLLEPEKKLLSERVKTKSGEQLGEFIACACGFKRASFVEIGGFVPYFHSYGEETEIVMRMLLKNQRMIFLSEIKVFHNYLPPERSNSWLNRFLINSMRNEVFIMLLHFPAVLMPFYLIGKYFSRLFYEIRNSKNKFNSIIQLSKGWVFGVLECRKILKNRNALSLSQFDFWVKTRW